jgi:hypothetical protein
VASNQQGDVGVQKHECPSGHYYTAVGHILAETANITITGNRNINAFQMIRATNSDATVTVTLEKYS